MQGGDLIKWDKVLIGYYVGIDIVEGLVFFFFYVYDIVMFEMVEFMIFVQDG